MKITTGTVEATAMLLFVCATLAYPEHTGDWVDQPNGRKDKYRRQALLKLVDEAKRRNRKTEP